jgi:hypothetical protein
MEGHHFNDEDECDVYLEEPAEGAMTNEFGELDAEEFLAKNPIVRSTEVFAAPFPPRRNRTPRARLNISNVASHVIERLISSQPSSSVSNVHIRCSYNIMLINKF